MIIDTTCSVMERKMKEAPTFKIEEFYCEYEISFTTSPGAVVFNCDAVFNEKVTFNDSVTFNNENVRWGSNDITITADVNSGRILNYTYD